MIPDPQIWAKAFIEVIKDKPEMALDEGFLIGWFANAFEAERIANTRYTVAVPQKQYEQFCDMPEIVHANRTG